MKPTAAQVVARRRAQRHRLIDRARAYAAGLDPSLSVQAVVVVGSVARGDFNADSDIDVLVVAERLPDDPVRRLRAIGSPAPGRVAALAWTTSEWQEQRRRGNPIAIDASEHGVWLLGDEDTLTA